VTQTALEPASISLASVRERGVSLHWHEAVAIVQGVIEELSNHATADLQRYVRDCPLTPERIEITNSGAVLLLPGGPLAENPAERLLELLLILLEPTGAPPELRAIGKSGLYPTPADLSRALAFFERPNRSGTILTVANRALEADAQAAAELELHRLQEKARHSADVPGKQTTNEKRRSSPNSRKGIPRRTLILAGVLGFVFLLVAAVGTVAWQTHRQQGARPQPLSAVSWKQVTTWVGSGVSAVSGRAQALLAAKPEGPGETTAGKADAPSGEPRTPTITRAKSSARQPSRLPSVLNGILPADDDATRRNETVRTQVHGDGGLASEPLPLASEPLPVDETLFVEVVESEPELTAIYSHEDAEVIPPIIMRPQLPLEQKRTLEAGTLEIVVSKTGDVDQVRLISPFNRYHDRMLVAAAKAWRFHVATRNGQPVKYRLRVQIAP